MTAKLLGLAPSGATDAATKGYVDTSTTPGNTGLSGGAGANLSAVAGAGITISSGIALAATVAGNGLTLTSGVIDVVGTNGITANANDVALASTVAGAGLTFTSGVVAVTAAAGAGIIVNADDIAVDYGPDPWKKQVRAATTAAGTLATSFANAQVIDGVTLATGDRILIKDQATGSENGIYTVNSSGAPTRAIDFNTTAQAANGCIVEVLAGTANSNTVWNMSNSTSPTIGTTALTFIPGVSGVWQAGTLRGGTASGGNLTLSSTSNATKGKILVGTSGYDEVNNRWGIATASPAFPLDVVGDGQISAKLHMGSWIVNSPSGTDDTWQTPSYGTNWLTSTTFNGLTALQSFQFRRDIQDNVQLVGLFKASGTTPSNPVFTLPAGYRPATQQMVPCYRNNGGTVTAGMAFIGTSGNVSMFAGANMGIAASNEYMVVGRFPLGNLT